jgi:hypothetical protein
MYALFKGPTQIVQAFPTESACLNAALAEGLIGEVQLVDKNRSAGPACGLSHRTVQEPYDPLETSSRDILSPASDFLRERSILHRIIKPSSTSRCSPRRKAPSPRGAFLLNLC